MAAGESMGALKRARREPSATASDKLAANPVSHEGMGPELFSLLTFT
jgi:hypothetical protein